MTCRCGTPVYLCEHCYAPIGCGEPAVLRITRIDGEHKVLAVHVGCLADYHRDVIEPQHKANRNE